MSEPEGDGATIAELRACRCPGDKFNPGIVRVFKAINGPWPCPGHGEEVDMHDEHTKLCRECWRKRFRPRT